VAGHDRAAQIQAGDGQHKAAGRHGEPLHRVVVRGQEPSGASGYPPATSTDPTPGASAPLSTDAGPDVSTGVAAAVAKTGATKTGATKAGAAKAGATPINATEPAKPTPATHPRTDDRRTMPPPATAPEPDSGYGKRRSDSRL